FTAVSVLGFGAMMGRTEAFVMAGFATPPLGRDQLVLFPEKLDEVIPQGHRVRLLDDILRRLDWTDWEATYDLTKGQPPLHPRVIAGAVLYGIMNRILSSRAVEEALWVRNDFRWLVEGLHIDHTTICKFRQKNSVALKSLFVQVGLVARELGHLPLESLGFDGTRIRANNRRSGSRSPEELRQAKDQLQQRFIELEEQAAQADASESERLGNENGRQLSEELAEVQRRQEKVDAAIAELEKLDKEPKRLPIVDPESRLTPNKDGGFAPNYTPHLAVDIDSGLAVSADV
ncbi:transposase, partial [Rhodopirellula sp. JC639]|uniref:transposase n=1 Tax=Stieleria mannarensis TaxID=2755585 RepID=UPI001602684E